MKNVGSVYDESQVYTYIKMFSVSALRSAAVRCIYSIFYNFFYRQFRAALLHHIPVSRVDHPLDQKIPFVPSWVVIYVDFVSFWIRMIAFLLRRYGRKAYTPVRDIVESIAKLYAFAAETYQKNLSTTNRPFYIIRPHFFFIHLLDPHLMCVPSLHVMLVIFTYTKFAAVLRSFGEAENYTAQIEEMKRGALAITHAILFIKQHSVNCIPAAMYAMTCFDAALFPPEDVESFAALLFDKEPAASPAPPEHSRKNSRKRPSSAPRTKLPAADASEIKNHIISLYRKFLAEGKTAQQWNQPLLKFLRQMPAFNQ